MSFEKLIGDMEALQKSLPSGSADAAILAASNGDNTTEDAGGTGVAAAAAAGTAGTGDGVPNVNSELDHDGKPKKKTDEEGLVKSFKVTLEDGSEIEAVDGAEMLKSLSAQLIDLNSRLETTNTQFAEKEVGYSAVLAKALEVMTAQSASIKQQDFLIKSLRTEVDRIGNQGRGRASVSTLLTVASKTNEVPLKKSFGDFAPQEFLAKCLDAQRAGKISGQDAMLAESYINANQQVPQSIVDRVIG